MSQYNILVVDDDREIVRSLGKLLELEGYRVKKSLQRHGGTRHPHDRTDPSDPARCHDAQNERPFRLMKIREKNNIPIIMLSAKTEESDKVIGLSMGADDYVTKPYNTAELMARVKSQLRRYFSLGAANGTTQSQDILKNGGLLLNRNTKELLVDGEPVRLTATEYKIMELLMEHPGYVFSAEEIYSQVWQEDAYSVENTVMVHIRRIREKNRNYAEKYQNIKGGVGIGYKIEKINGD